MLLQVDGFVRGFLAILHRNDRFFFGASDAGGAGLSNGAEIFIIGGVLRAPHPLLRQFEIFDLKKKKKKNISENTLKPLTTPLMYLYIPVNLPINPLIYL
jgi:hypothetical protein